MEDNSSTMIKLTGPNYLIWKPKMEDILYCKDLYDPIEGDEAKPKEKTDEEWKRMNRKTIGTIRQWVDDCVFHHVAKETSAKSLWQKLENLYERKIVQNKIFLIRRLTNLKFKEGRTVAEHLSEFQSLVNQLATVKVVLNDELQALILLSSLPDTWETLVMSLNNSAPNGILSLNTVKDSMFNEETRRKDMGEDNVQALVTENRGRSNNRRPRGHSRSRGRSKSRDNRKCYHCGKEGHIQRNCRIWKRQQKDENQRQGDDKNTTAAVSDTQEIVVLSFGDEECNHVADHSAEWIVDSAASYHATPTKEFFTSYKAGDFGTVKMGNTSHSKIVGVGDVCIQTDAGCTLTLKDVRHVPDLRLNLICIRPTRIYKLFQ